ncbi:MAG TPA: hypothetical protein VF507_10905 [Pyrinomonadaceae bacterium]|jgi:hypothetical protein
MRRCGGYLVIASLTFCCGLASALLWHNHRTPNEIVQISPIALPPESHPKVEQSEIEQEILDRTWVYVHIYSYRDLEGGRGWHGEFAIFYPSGEYAEVYSPLARYKKSPRGEWVFEIYSDYTFSQRGKWCREPDGTISSTLILNKDIPFAKLPNDYRKLWTIRQPSGHRLGSILEADGKIYLPASNMVGLGSLPSVVKYPEMNLVHN